jgi:hypothetical protein
MEPDWELRHSRDLSRLSRELRRMDNKEVTKRMRKELRKAAKPLVPIVRASIRNIPSGRAYGVGGLRSNLSKATRLEVKTTGRKARVSIRVDGRKMPSHFKALPQYVEGAKPRWRHPIFGNRQVWAQQPAQPYFYKVVAPAAGPRSRVAVNYVLDGITRDITR